MNQLTLIFLGLAISFSVMAKSNIKPNPDLLETEWQSKWITHPKIIGDEPGVYLFKKQIELPEKPGTFIINISADNRYVLYVNGKVTGRGPTRGDINRWLFETLDIAPFLQKGKNHIAVKVWNMGKLKPLAQISHQTGLIIQGNSSKEKIINTNKTWQVSPDKSYSFYRINHLKRFYAAGPGEKFDGQKHPWNWKTSENTAWRNAKEGPNGQSLKSLSSTGKPSGHLLFPSPLPAMEAKKQAFQSIRRLEGISNANALLAEEGSVTIPANKTVTMLLDHGQLTNAYPQLYYSQGKNSTIKITYAESLFIPKDGKPTFHKGNRNKIEGKVMWGNYDILIADGGKKRFFEPLWWRCFRYVQLEIETGKEPLILEKFESEFTAYPLALKADFKCNNPLLKEVFEVAWHTQRLCAGETFFDTPYYEQLQYTGDTRIQSLITAYASGDTLLWKDAIMDYYDSRFPFGLMQSRYPNSQTQIIATFSLVWITMVHDYMMHCNDDEFIQSMLPAILDILTWYDQRVEDNGMIGKLETWLFVDWVKGWPLGYPPLDKNKKNSSILGLQYVYTLQKALEIFNAYNYPGLKQKWELRANTTREAVISNCWDEQKKLLADTPDKDKFSQHANIFAVLTNTFNTKKQKEIMMRILNDSTIAQSTFYFDFYLVEALKKAGLGDLYVEKLHPLKAMIDNGLTTFVEKPEPTRSDCHAWSASPVYYYYNLIAGISPVEKGFKRIEMRPSLGELNFIEGKMPLRGGFIAFDLKKKGKLGISGTVTLPKNLSGTFYWQGKELELVSGINKIKL